MSNRADYVGPQLCLEAFESMVSGRDVCFKECRGYKTHCALWMLPCLINK